MIERMLKITQYNHLLNILTPIKNLPLKDILNSNL